MGRTFCEWPFPKIHFMFRRLQHQRSSIAIYVRRVGCGCINGRNFPKAFAFCSYSKGKEEKVSQEWQAKNVTPILYREHHNHFYLHETLYAWEQIIEMGSMVSKLS